MIGEEKERQCKKLLAEAMGKMQRNIDGMGSREAILSVDKYVASYNKLNDTINELVDKYISVSSIGLTWKPSLDMEIAKAFRSAKRRIDAAVEKNDADEVQRIMDDYVYGLWLRYPGQVFIQTCTDDIDYEPFPSNTANVA